MVCVATSYFCTYTISVSIYLQVPSFTSTNYWTTWVLLQFEDYVKRIVFFSLVLSNLVKHNFKSIQIFIEVLKYLYINVSHVRSFWNNSVPSRLAELLNNLRSSVCTPWIYLAYQDNLIWEYSAFYLGNL